MPTCTHVAATSMRFAANAVTNAQADELRHLGLSPSAFVLLMSLHNTHNTPGATLERCQLVERLLLGRPSLTACSTRSRPRDWWWANLTPTTGAGRAALTEAARGLLESHFAEHYRCQAELLGDHSADELAT